MNIFLSPDRTMYDLITQYPELKAVFIRLGFDQLLNPISLQTVGRIMTLRKGSKMKGIDLHTIDRELRDSNFQLEDINE